MVSFGRSGSALGTTRAFRGPYLEAIAEPASHSLEVSHAAGTGGLSSLCLLGPVIYRKHQNQQRRGREREGGGGGGIVHFRVLAAGYPQDAQVCFWMWKERRPQRRHNVWDLFYEEILLKNVSRGQSLARGNADA